MTAPLITVRHCRELAEFSRCVEIQRLVWGEDIVVPAPMFVVAVETGGQILGAFEGERMVGFTLGLAGFRGRHPHIHSHMTAVLPETQNRGIGRMLKLAQRTDALSRGIELVEWTFDPLELRNAHFNLNRLGAIVRRFAPNLYGVTESPLHAGLPTDRFVAEWRLKSPRVVAVLAGKPVPAAKVIARIPLPRDIGERKLKDAADSARIQRGLRIEFEKWLDGTHAITGIEFEADLAHYVVEAGPIQDFEGD